MGDLATFLADSEGLDQQGRLLREALDGRGAWRIVSAWEQLLDTAQEPTERTSKPFAVRPAEIGDARLLFDWRNDESARRQSRTREALEWDTHRSWLQEAITDPHRKLLIVESENEPIATVRWDRRAPIDWEVSVTIAPQHRRKGYGRRVLSEAEAALTFDPPLRMVADIHIDNGASRRLFSAAGYLPQAPPDADGFERRAKWRLPTG
ncbi:GNAT family N-acetyltransferase [Microbacterium sp. AK031]|uniref:GNAT family N-acetyltransferase n=1 Tax=Microbacterium sp. AK031 TaxID=2723076 RepID=UPI0037C50AEA